MPGPGPQNLEQEATAFPVVLPMWFVRATFQR